VNKKVANIKNSIKGELEKISIEIEPFQDLQGYKYTWKEGAGPESAPSSNICEIVP